MNRALVLAVTLLVVAWRVLALRFPSSIVVVAPEYRLPLMLLGLLFVGCGAVAWWRRPGRWTAILFCYGAGGAVHWGGAVGAAAWPNLDLGLFFGYLAASGMAEAAFLHLALVFPSGRRLARPWRVLLYLPAVLALLLALVPRFVERSALEPVIGVLLLLFNLFGLAGGVLLIVSLLSRRQPLLALGIALGGLLSLLGSTLPGPPDAWNLATGLIPLSLAIALAGAEAESG